MESGNTISTITSALTTALQSVSSNAMGVIADVLPYALTIVGAVMVVTIGIRVFKKIGNK